MTINLATLLLDHPFDDDQPLIHGTSVDYHLSLGETERIARDRCPGPRTLWRISRRAA